ncbi:hypothetical protein ANO11243_061410 [Dothideomycetidae sp. 11243]|nr:hypothetical protein ANO11243_061410 [fungal sp. No.11243]
MGGIFDTYGNPPGFGQDLCDRLLRESVAEYAVGVALIALRTIGARNHMLVKVLAVYVFVGYVAVQLSLFLECRPFGRYWQIRPASDLNCMVYWSYIAVQMAFNISSDIAMLFIPLPMVLGVKVNPKQKMVLLVLFSMGLFVIASALTTKIEYYISIYDVNFVFWYFREASVAVYVANLPMIWPLMREVIPGLRSFFGYGYGKNSKLGGKTGTSGTRSRAMGTVVGTVVATQIADEDRDEKRRVDGGVEDVEKGIRTQVTVEMNYEDGHGRRSLWMQMDLLLSVDHEWIPVISTDDPVAGGGQIRRTFR